MDLVRSEQNHMDQAKSMIDKFGLQTPVPDMPGELENQTLKEIYNRLQAQGKLSHQEALKSAATFEEISIMDLEKEIAATNMGRNWGCLSGAAGRIQKAPALLCCGSSRARDPI